MNQPQTGRMPAADSFQLTLLNGFNSYFNKNSIASVQVDTLFNIPLAKFTLRSVSLQQDNIKF